jgi:hypothetical protein
MTTLSANVDQGSGHGPLSRLMSMALVIFGDNNMAMADGQLVHLLLHFANMVVDEVNAHPYRDDIDPVEYYVSPEDVRPVADQIMIAGIAGFYAAQQASSKAPALMSSYYRTMNQRLWFELNGLTDIQARPRDAGSYSRINGQPLPAEEE